MVAQLVTVIAVLAGAACTYIIGKLAERDRYARDLRLRWDQRRLDAYIAYVTAAKMVGAAANTIRDMRMKGSSEEAVEKRTTELTDLEMQRNRSFEALPLIADGDTIEAGHQLNRAVWGLVTPIRQGRTVPEQEWLDLADTWIAALNNFHVAARQSLSVVGTFSRRDIASMSVGHPERHVDNGSPTAQPDPRPGR
jgi:hypothetical protein